MIPETYYAGCYWLGRQESAEACARRSEEFFLQLSRCDPAWTGWHEAATSFEEARKRQLTPNAGAFEKLFGMKENRVGDGFRFWLWAGDNPDETTSVSGDCGASTPWVPSSCVLKPPPQGPLAERMLTASVMSEVLRVMALTWEPEWGVATSHEHRLRVAEPGKAGTFVGWVTYVSRQRGALPPLPAPVRIEPVGDTGALIILTPERFTVTNPEHVALASSVHGLLDEAGLLRPLKPR